MMAIQESSQRKSQLSETIFLKAKIKNIQS